MGIGEKREKNPDWTKYLWQKNRFIIPGRILTSFVVSELEWGDTMISLD